MLDCKLAPSVDAAIQAVPESVDPGFWKGFMTNEQDLKKTEQCEENAKIRKKLKHGHTLGRCTYAEKQRQVVEKNPDAKLRRVHIWFMGYTRKDGTVLESAKETYAAEEKRKDDKPDSIDLDNDEITEVFGPYSQGRVQGVGSHISKIQLELIGMADAKVEQKEPTYFELMQELDKFSSQVNTRMSSVEDLLADMLQEMKKRKQVEREGIATHTVTTDIGSNSANRPTHPPLPPTPISGMRLSRSINP